MWNTYVDGVKLLVVSTQPSSERRSEFNQTFFASAYVYGIMDRFVYMGNRHTAFKMHNANKQKKADLFDRYHVGGKKFCQSLVPITFEEILHPPAIGSGKAWHKIYEVALPTPSSLPSSIVRSHIITISF